MNKGSLYIGSILVVAGLVFSAAFGSQLFGARDSESVSDSDADHNRITLKGASVQASGPSNIAFHPQSASVVQSISAPSISATVDDSVPPAVSAEAIIVEDLESGRTFFVHEPNKRWPAASLTKLMTALVALETLGSSFEVPISEAVLLTEGVAGNFSSGEVYTVSDLVNTLLVVSSNDAGSAILEAHDSVYGEGSFVAAMNRRAATLGMQETTFTDPTGLLITNQSTVVDLAVFTRFLFTTYPELFETSSRTEVAVTDRVSGTRRVLKNINYLAGDDRFLGGKTGFIDDAGGNLISILEHNDQPVIFIVLGSSDQDTRFEDTEAFYRWLDLNS